MNKLIALRAKRGLSKRSLARKAGVALGTIDRIEAGYKAHWGTLGRLANVLECDLLELNDLAESPAKLEELVA